MKQDWHPDELAQHWTLSPEECELLSNKAGATRLNFAVLLKAFQFDGRFPDRREDVAGGIVAHLAIQTGVPREAYSEEEWSERTQRHQRAQIREHCGVSSTPRTKPTLVARSLSKITAYGHLRSQTSGAARNGTVATPAAHGRGAT